MIDSDGPGCYQVPLEFGQEGALPPLPWPDLAAWELRR